MRAPLIPPDFENEMQFLEYAENLFRDYSNQRRGNEPVNDFDFWLLEMRSEIIKKIKESLSLGLNR